MLTEREDRTSVTFTWHSSVLSLSCRSFFTVTSTDVCWQRCSWMDKCPLIHGQNNWHYSKFRTGCGLYIRIPFQCFSMCVSIKFRRDIYWSLTFSKILATYAYARLILFSHDSNIIWNVFLNYIFFFFFLRYSF